MLNRSRKFKIPSLVAMAVCLFAVIATFSVTAFATPLDITTVSGITRTVNTDYSISQVHAHNGSGENGHPIAYATWRVDLFAQEVFAGIPSGDLEHAYGIFSAVSLAFNHSGGSQGNGNVTLTHCDLESVTIDERSFDTSFSYDPAFGSGGSSVYIQAFHVLDPRTYQAWQVTYHATFLIDLVYQDTQHNTLYSPYPVISNYVAEDRSTDAIKFRNDNYLTSQVLAAADQINNRVGSIDLNVQAILDILDDDTVSQPSDLESAASDYETAASDMESAESEAIEVASSAADVGLDIVENFDSQEFWSRQRQATNFWHDVTQFILDDSNIGIFATSLFIVTIVGLFIFVLRL